MSSGFATSCGPRSLISPLERPLKALFGAAKLNLGNFDGKSIARVNSSLLSSPNLTASMPAISSSMSFPGTLCKMGPNSDPSVPVREPGSRWCDAARESGRNGVSRFLTTERGLFGIMGSLAMYSDEIAGKVVGWDTEIDGTEVGVARSTGSDTGPKGKEGDIGVWHLSESVSGCEYWWAWCSWSHDASNTLWRWHCFWSERKWEERALKILCRATSKVTRMQPSGFLVVVWSCLWGTLMLICDSVSSSSLESIISDLIPVTMLRSIWNSRKSSNWFRFRSENPSSPCLVGPSDLKETYRASCLCSKFSSSSTSFTGGSWTPFEGTGILDLFGSMPLRSSCPENLSPLTTCMSSSSMIVSIWLEPASLKLIGAAFSGSASSALTT